jgi:hypothetical protein
MLSAPFAVDLWNQPWLVEWKALRAQRVPSGGNKQGGSDVLDHLMLMP